MISKRNCYESKHFKSNLYSYFLEPFYVGKSYLYIKVWFQSSKSFEKKINRDENIHNIIVVLPGADSFAVDFKFFFQDDLQNYTLTFF